MAIASHPKTHRIEMLFPKKIASKQGKNRMHYRISKFNFLPIFFTQGEVYFSQFANKQAEVESRTQGSRPRPRTAFPRTDTLSGPRTGMVEAKNQGHKRKCSPKKKRSSQKFFMRSPQKNVFQKIFQALHKILTIQKIVLSSSRGQANFRGLEASRPRPRTSKCVLGYSTSVNKLIVYRCYQSLPLMSDRVSSAMMF